MDGMDGMDGMDTVDTVDTVDAVDAVDAVDGRGDWFRSAQFLASAADPHPSDLCSSAPLLLCSALNPRS